MLEHSAEVYSRDIFDNDKLWWPPIVGLAIDYVITMFSVSQCFAM